MGLGRKGVGGGGMGRERNGHGGWGAGCVCCVAYRRALQRLVPRCPRGRLGAGLGHGRRGSVRRASARALLRVSPSSRFVGGRVEGDVPSSRSLGRRRRTVPSDEGAKRGRLRRGRLPPLRSCGRKSPVETPVKLARESERVTWSQTPELAHMGLAGVGGSAGDTPSPSSRGAGRG